MIAKSMTHPCIFTRVFSFLFRTGYLLTLVTLANLSLFATNSIVITSPGNGSNADQNTDLSVTVNYQSNGGGYQTPTWAYRIGSDFPGYGSPHGGTQVNGLHVANDFLNGQYDGMKQIHAALLDQSGNLHNPPVKVSVQVNYQSGGGGNQSGGGAWSVNPADYANNMTMSALVRVDGANATSGSLAAFVGSQIRGLNSSPTVVPMGAYQGQTIYSLVIYGDTSGQTLSFKWSSDGTGANAIPLTNAVGSPITYTINDNQGSATSPIIFEGISAGSISIASPTNHSSIFSPNDNLSVNISYQSGGGGNQTPMWAYRINSPFPSYGSPHGGTQVSGSYIANSFLANESLGAKTVYVTLLDHNGTLRNPPVFANIQVNYQSGGGGSQSGGGGNSIVITSPGNGSNADQNTDLSVTVNYQSNGGGYQTPTWAYRIGSDFPGYGSPHGGTQVNGLHVANDFLNGQYDGMKQIHAALLDQSGNLHNPPVKVSVQVNYQSGGGGSQSGGGGNQSPSGDSITITSPGNQSSIYSHNDNLSVSITYQSGGGGNQTPLWAYRINSPFPGYGSPHGGTQVNGSLVANDFLANQALGSKVVSVTLLDQNGNLRNPPMNQTVVVYYQSQTGGHQSGGGGTHVSYTGPYQSPTGNFKTDTRNALFDDYVEFKGLFSVGKLKFDYNTSTYFNQSIDELGNQLTTLSVPPSTARGNSIDAWISQNFTQANSFDHHLTMQAFKLTAIGNVDLNKSSDIKNLAKNHNRIYFQVYNRSVIIDGVKQGSSIWALSIEGDVSNSSDLIVDMSGKVYNGDFNSYWYTVHGIETWNNSSWFETSYATDSAGIDSMLFAHPVIFDPKALVHTIKPFDFIPDGQADLANDKSLLPATVNYGKIYFQKYHFPHVATTTQSSAPMSGGSANAVSAVGAGLMNPLDIVAGQIRDQGYQSGSAGYQSSGGIYQTPASGAFMPYTGPYVSPSFDLRIDIRNALFDDFIENKNLNSITKLKNDYNTTKEFNDSVDALVSNLKTLPTPPSTSRGDAVDEWIKGGFEQVKNIDPKKETEFVWALSIEEPSHNGGNIVIDMHGNIYNNTDYESYWLSVYGVATHNDDNWTEVEYPTTVSGLVRLYQDYPFISPSVVMESKYKLAVLETNTPQVQGNVITLSGTIRDSHGTEILQSGFLVSSKGHPFMNDPASTVVRSSTITNTLTASYSAPTGGVYYVRSFAETKGGFSEGPVRKAEIISGAQSGNDPQAAALAIIKQGTTELAGGWRQSPWFGLFLDRGNGWVFHQIHGWLYLSSDGVNGLWVWHERRKWLWSTEGLYPHIYQSGPASWIYMLGVFNSKAIFFNYSTNQVEFE